MSNGKAGSLTRSLRITELGRAVLTRRLPLPVFVNDCMRPCCTCLVCVAQRLGGEELECE